MEGVHGSPIYRVLLSDPPSRWALIRNRTVCSRACQKTNSSKEKQKTPNPPNPTRIAHHHNARLPKRGEAANRRRLVCPGPPTPAQTAGCTQRLGRDRHPQSDSPATKKSSPGRQKQVPIPAHFCQIQHEHAPATISRGLPLPVRVWEPSDLTVSFFVVSNSNPNPSSDQGLYSYPPSSVQFGLYRKSPAFARALFSRSADP